MYQHPIPQNVTSYQFRLIGDMTIKQFFLLLIGVGGAVFFYFTNLPQPIKWSFIVLSAFLGIAMAFFPIEGRPLDQWIIAFIKAIYQPTEYIWQKVPQQPDFFNYKPNEAHPTQTETISYSPKKQQIQSIMQTLPPSEGESHIQSQLQTQLTTISDLFNQVTPATVPSQQAQLQTFSTSSTPFQPISAQQTFSSPTHIQPTTPTTSLVEQPMRQETPTQPERIINTPPSVPANIQTSQVLYENPSTSIKQPTAEQITPAAIDKPVETAITSNDLPFPNQPQTPNTITGMILDQQNNLIENAIIEIRDNQNLPVRATKSNKLGQFFSTTPLPNGVYHLQVEKPGYNFAILKLELNGNLLHPVKVIAS